MFCENCGKQLPDNVKFCTGCGTRVLPVDVSEEVENDVDTSTVNDIRNVENEPNEQNIEVETVPEENKASETAPEEKKRSIAARAFAHFGAVVLSLILFACVIATTALGLVHNAVSQKTLMSAVDNVNLSKIKVSSVVDVDKLAEQGMNVESENLFDFIYDNINQSAMEEPMSREKFRELVESEEIQGFLTETLNKNIVALASDGRTESDILDDLVDFINQEKKTLSKKLGYELTDKRISNLKKTIDEKYGSSIEKFESVKLDSFVDEKIADIVTISFSNWLFISILIFDILLAILIYIVLRLFKQGTVYCGVVVAFVGAVYLLLAFALEALVGMFLNGTALYLAKQFIGVFAVKMIIVSAIMIVMGILIPIIVYVISNIRRKKRARA